MADNRLFARYTGRFWVRILEEYIEPVEVFGKNWSLLDFILMAYKHLTGEDRRTIDEHTEAKNWELQRLLFHNGEGFIEVKMKGGAL